MSNTTSTHPLSFDTPLVLHAFEQLVSEDLRQIRRELDDIGRDKADLLQTSVFRSMLHIALDWSCLFAALWATVQWGWWAVPASLLVIGG